MRVFFAFAAVTVALGALPCPSVAQGVPPAPVPDLIARFRDNPNRNPALFMAMRSCPLTAGTWQHEYVSGLMALDLTPGEQWSLVKISSSVISRCEDPLLSGWLRDLLSQGATSPYSPNEVFLVGAALGRSASDRDRRAALDALYDVRFPDESRGEMVFEWLRGTDTPHSDAIELATEAYGEVPGLPPRYITQTAVALVRAQEGEGRGLRTLRAFLAAVLERPDVEAAQPILGGLLSAAVNLDGSDVWIRELGDAIEELADGRRPAPAALREFLGERLDLVCRGARTAAQPRCQR